MAVGQAPHVNPPAAALGTLNAVMGGLYPSHRNRAPIEQARNFEGPLSIKVVLQGQVVWTLGKQRHVVDAGFCLVLNRGETYSLTFDPAETVETFCPFFDHGVADDAARSLMTSDEILLDDPNGTSRNLSFDSHVRPLDSELAAPLARLSQLAHEPEVCNLAWDEAFLALASALVRTAKGWRTEHAGVCHRSSTHTEITRRLNRARDLIHAEAHRRLRLDQIAAAASLSPHHFHRLFGAAFRVTPGRYVTDLRLARAARLLAATDAPVTEICLSVGFESLGSFSTRFRRAFGTSPASWRKIARSEKRTRTVLD